MLELPRAEVGQGITTAVAMPVAEEMSVRLSDVDVLLSDARPKPRSEYTLVGKPITRIDARNHITGKTKFALDMDHGRDVRPGAGRAGSHQGQLQQVGGAVTARATHEPIASTGSTPQTRRQFLLRGGLLGAAVVVAGTSLRLPLAGAIEPVFPGHVRKALQQLARDTISGLVVFAVPGSDAYSRAQGVTSPTPGALDARAEQVVLDALDNFLPFPAQLTSPLAAALATGTSDALLPAAMSPLTSGLEEAAARFDKALGIVLENDEAVPLSALVSLLLNFVATSVDPLAILGPFPASPFANLRAAQKAEVFRRLEGDYAELIELLDSAAPEPGKETLSGFVKFLAGTLLEFAAFTPFTEFGVFDRERRVATERPVGWELTRYLPGRQTPVDGRDEFKGYYRGRRSVG